jgi:hypothetical protein
MALLQVVEDRLAATELMLLQARFTFHRTSLNIL